MELKHLARQLVYRIEPNPQGGFIARSYDPATPTLEAPTKEELQQKIQAASLAKLTEALPSLKSVLENAQFKSVQTGCKTKTSFVLGSTGSDAQTVEQETAEKTRERAAFAELVEEDFPQLAQVLVAQAASKSFPNSMAEGTGNVSASAAVAQDSNLDAVAARVRDAISNAPITPEAGSGGTIFRLGWLLLFLALIYFFLHRL